MAEGERVFLCRSDEPTAVKDDEPTAVNTDPCFRDVRLPVSQMEFASPCRTVQQEASPGSVSRKRIRGGDEAEGATLISPGAVSSCSSSGSSAAGLCEPPPKRIRLRGKQAPPSAEATSLEGCLPEVDYQEDFVSRRVWHGMSDKAQYNYVYEKIRCFFLWRVHAEKLRSENERHAWMIKTCSEKQREARKAFRDISPEERNDYIRKWMRLAKPPLWLEKTLEKRFLSTEAVGKVCLVKSQGVLVTWNLPAEGGSDSVKLAQSLPPWQLTMDELVTRLRHEPTAKELWGRVMDHGQRIKPLAGADDVAVCLEVCPETYMLQKTLRLHIHMFLKSNGQNLRLRHMDFYDFEGCTSHVSTSIGGLCSTKGRSNWSGFFYCCLKDKLGTVFTEATKTPFTKFMVNPAWILSLVQAQKLSISAARELLVRCVNASRHLKELESYDNELEKSEVQVAIKEAQVLLVTNLKKQKFYDQAHSFVKQFDEPLHRYKFLVLSGPSRVGKTAFAKTLCEDGKEVLEVNCASGDEPNLRAYRLRLHGLILFDEIVAGQVAQQRKLFQAQSAPVQMGCSATNCHSYDVFVWRKRLVLASNNWHSSLAQLGAGDKEWIHANSIVLDVDAAMWEC